MKKKSGHRRRTKVVRRSRKNLRRTVKRKRLGKGRRRPTRRYSRVQRGGDDRLNNNLECFVTVGDIYYYGYGNLERDSNMAFKLFSVAAEKGNAVAQFKLGYMYQHGRGVAKDDAEALRYYGLAAAQGNADAAQKLKEMR